MRKRYFFLFAAMVAIGNPAPPQPVEAKLAACRKQIDETDQQIVKLLNQRARIVARVGGIKKEAHLPVAAPDRERKVLDHIAAEGSAGPLPQETLRRIYATVIQEMRTWEASLRE
jgi:chorismate mutase